MIASVVFVDLGRAAKLGRHHYQRALQQAAVVEIADQRGVRLVQRRSLLGKAVFDVVVVIPTAVSQRDKPHAGLHQSPRQQHPLARLVASVLVAHLGRFLVQRKRLARLLRAHELVGSLIKLIHRVERVGAFQFAEVVIDDLEDAFASLEAFRRTALGQREVAHGEIATGRVATQPERPEGAAEIAAPGVLVGHVGNADVRRQIFARSELVRHHTADARVLERRAGAVAGEHVVRAALVGCLAVGHRAADGDLVRDLGGLFERLAEAHPRKLGGDVPAWPAILERGVRLGVERLLVCHAAGQENMDDRLGLPFLAFVVF